MNIFEINSDSNIEYLEKLSTLIFKDIFGSIDSSNANNKVQLKSIADLKTGTRLSKSNLTNNGKFPVYGGNGLIGYHTEFLFEPESIVIGRVGKYCGNVHITKPFSSVTSNAYVLELYDDKSFNLYFVKKCLELLNLNNYKVGATIPYLKAGDILDQPIPLVSKNKQKVFADIYSEINAIKDLIMERDKQLAYLQN